MTNLVEQMLFHAFGGLGIFLLGLHFLSHGTRGLAAARLRDIMETLARNRITALLTGIVVTGVVQSSSVVTVMIVGFVNSGVLTLQQAIAMVMGANIGTTVTAIFIALPITRYGLPMVGAAALVFVLSRRERTRHGAMAFMGLGMILLGLEFMTSGFRPIRSMPEFLALLEALEAQTLGGMALCILLGTVVTALIQSSSALIAIVMGMAASGVLGWQTSLAVAMGGQIGSTITALIAAATLSVNARRTSYAHLCFNVVGMACALAAFPLYLAWTIFLIGGDPGHAVMGDDGLTRYPLAPLAVAAFVTSFNVFTSALLLPWVPQAARLLQRIGGGRMAEFEDLSVPRFLFSRSLRDPQLAVSLLEKEQDRFRRALTRCLDGVCHPERAGPRELAALRLSLAALHREINDFGYRLCRRDLPARTAVCAVCLLQAQDLSAALMQRLLALTDTMDSRELADDPRRTAVCWIEALNVLVRETMEALAESDRGQLETLEIMTADQGPNIEAIRRRYLEHGEYSTSERRLLLVVLGQIEGCLWLLNRLCRRDAR